MNNIYKSTKVAPYVYICIHKETKEFYIGYRELNVTLKRPSTTDLPLYKTSSKKVNPNFADYNWTIIAEFFNGDDAYTFEQELICENWKDPLLLNEQYRLSTTKFKAKKGVNKGRKLSKEQCAKLRGRTPWNKGLTKEDPRVAKNVKNFIPDEEKNKEFSKRMIEWHQENSVAGKNNPMYGVKRKRIICEHCEKDISDANYSRWHGDRCKLAP